MNNLLMVVGDPYWDTSVANRTIVETMKSIFPDITVSNLFLEYPDFKFDIDAEQKKLISADTVIWQFPINWYSCPSLMHRWMEEVLAYGFAYGSKGTALHGKKVVASFTSGSAADQYCREGVQYYTIDELMPPFIATARLCGLEWLPHVYTGGMNTAGARTAEALDKIKKAAQDHAERLARTVSA